MRFFPVYSSLLLHAFTTTQTLGFLFHSQSNGFTARPSRLILSRTQTGLSPSLIATTHRRRRKWIAQRQGLPKLYLNRGQELVSKDSTDTFPRGKFSLSFNRTGDGILGNSVERDSDEQMAPRFFPDYFVQQKKVRKASDFDSNTTNNTQEYDVKSAFAVLIAASAFVLVLSEFLRRNYRHLSGPQS